MFGIGKSTVCEIVLDFCFEVWKELKKVYLNSYPLTDATIKKTIKGFEKMGFPQCIGAIDGCHIEVKPHREDATDFYNYKGWYSTILLAIVDYKYDFLYINVGCPGRCNDSTIYEQSSLKSHDINNNIFEQNTRIIKSVAVPPLLIADSAFKLKNNMMKPYPFRVEAEISHKLFIYKLSKCRRVVENAFGHLKARFRRIGKGLDNHIENASMIIKACCVLHNFLNAKRDEVHLNWIQQQMEEEVTSNRVQPDNFVLHVNERNGILIRNAISLNFMDDPDGDGETIDVDGETIDDVDDNSIDDVDVDGETIDDVDGETIDDIDDNSIDDA